MSTKKRDFTLHLAAPELEYSACVSLLRKNDNKQPISLGAVAVTLVSVCGFSWFSFVCLKPESRNVAHENLVRSLGLVLVSNSKDRQYHVGLSLKHSEILVVLSEATLK